MYCDRKSSFQFKFILTARTWVTSFTLEQQWMFGFPNSDALMCTGCCSLCNLCMLWPLCFSWVPLVSAGKFHAHLISLDMLQGLDFFESFSFQSGSRCGWRESNLNIETLNHPLLADWSQMADIRVPSSLSRQSQPPLESYILNPLSLLWCVFVGVGRIALLPWSKTLHYTVLVESKWFSWESFAAECRVLVCYFFILF